MDTIALADGDLRWLFPQAVEREALRATLGRARDEILQLARHISGRAGWTGEGVEFHSLPSGQIELVAYAESADATFWAELRPAGYFSGDPHTTGWYVDSEITVRCDHEQDCGTHTIEERNEQHFAESSQAAEGFLTAVMWLRERGTAEAAGYWRAHDPTAAEKG